MTKPFGRHAAAVLAVVLFAAGTAYGQGFGVALGANFGSLSDIETGDAQATFDNASGFHVHAWFDLPLGLVAVRPGIRYMGLGELDFEATGPGVPDVTETVDLNLVEIPVDLRFRLGAMPLISPYILAGPVFRFPTSDEDERFKSFSFAGGIGAGVAIGLAGLRVYPEIKYTFGLSSFTDDTFTIGNVEFEADENANLNVLMLSIGIGL